MRRSTTGFPGSRAKKKTRLSSMGWGSMFKMIDADELVANAKALGLKTVELEVPLKASYGEDAAITQTAWMTSKHRDKNYVWLHVDAEGVPFYAGQGYGAHAWEKKGGHAWEWFIRNELGGDYRVVILAVGISSDQAESLLKQVQGTYAGRLLIQNDMSRGKLNYEAMEEDGRINMQLRHYYDVVGDTTDRDQLFENAKAAQKLQYQRCPEKAETGRFYEVLGAMNAFQSVNTFFITHVIEGYLARGDVEGAREALAEFKQKAPILIDHAKVVRLQKMVDLGGFMRVPKWVKEMAAKK